MTLSLRDRWQGGELCWALIWVACAFALWLNANPYIGIDHDARLYALMAYRWLSPEAFVRDPWFTFGSQDDYSLFSPLLAGLFSLLGVADGAVAATLLQGLLFAIAVVILARAGLGRAAYPLPALLLASFPILYSPNSLLNVTEGFVTARGFAVPLSLLGLAWSVRRRPLGAALFHGAALALHPIMAAAPAAVSILAALPGRLRPWLLVAGWVGYVLLLLAALQGHLPLVAGEWRRFLEPSPLVFTEGWIWSALVAVSPWAALLWIASRHGAQPLRTIYGLTLPVVVSGIAFSYLATLAPWTTALQAQFWRGLWLLKLMALCALGDLFWQHLLCRAASMRRVMALGAVLALLLGFYQALLGAAALLLLFHLPLSSLEVRLQQQPRIFWGLLLPLLVLSFPALLFELAGRVSDVHIQGFGQELLHGLWRNAGLGIFTLGIWWLIWRLPQWGGAALAAALVLFAASLWDGRLPDRRMQEARYSVDGRHGLFAAQIPRGATVSWHGATELVWFEQATAGYAGSIHATGLVFSEQRTLLLAQRYSRVVLASMERSPPPDLSGQPLRIAVMGVIAKRSFVHEPVIGSYEDAGKPSAAGIAWLCLDPALDFVIADALRPDAMAQALDAHGKLWHLYRCDQVVAGRHG